ERARRRRARERERGPAGPLLLMNVEEREHGRSRDERREGAVRDRIERGLREAGHQKRRPEVKDATPRIDAPGEAVGEIDQKHLQWDVEEADPVENARSAKTQR